MKKLLKVIFWLLIVALVSWTLTSCEKTEAEPPIIEPTWYLDFDCPALNYSCRDLPVHAISDNIGAHQVKVGITLDFENGAFKCRLFTEGADVHVTQFTGVCGSHAFTVHGNTIGICGGVQNSEVIYELTLK